MVKPDIRSVAATLRAHLLNVIRVFWRLVLVSAVVARLELALRLGVAQLGDGLGRPRRVGWGARGAGRRRRSRVSPAGGRTRSRARLAVFSHSSMRRGPTRNESSFGCLSRTLEFHKPLKSKKRFHTNSVCLLRPQSNGCKWVTVKQTNSLVQLRSLWLLLFTVFDHHSKIVLLTYSYLQQDHLESQLGSYLCRRLLWLTTASCDWLLGGSQR